MILITGASRGIGKYLLEKYKAAGKDVAGTFLHTSPDPHLAEHYTKVDVTDFTEVEGWVSGLGDKAGHLVLLNCAGNNYNAFAHKADMERWTSVIRTNLIGTFNVIRAVLPLMRAQQYGRVINFSSIVAQAGVPGTSAYAASKSGLWGLTKSLAAENAAKGITINSLNLGYFDIGMITEVPDEFSNTLKSRIPSGSFGDPQNIFNAVEFILRSEYLNGSSIDINGGLR